MVVVFRVLMRLMLLGLSLGLGACAASLPPQSGDGAAAEVDLAVIQRGWHTELALRTDDLSGPLRSLGPARQPSAYVLIGYGAKDYFSDPQAGADKAARSLWPGPGAINLTALPELRADDEAQRQVVWLRISAAQARGLQDFVWRSLEPAEDGGPPRPFVTLTAGSMFYDTRVDYSVLHNCNRWAADALEAGGLPFDGPAWWFAAMVLEQARRIAERQSAGLR